jgi:cell division protein FtsW
MTKRLLLVIVALGVFVIGLVMIFNTTSAEILDHYDYHELVQGEEISAQLLAKNTHQAVVKQVIYALGGAILAIGATFLGYRKLILWSPYLLGFFTLLLVIVLIPGVGREVNGSRRWLNVAGYSMQPSEFVKILIPAYFIYRFLAFGNGLRCFKDFLRIVGMISIPMGLILIEPNNGTVIVIGIILIVLCIAVRINFRYWALPLLCFALIGAVSAYNLSYVQGRLKVYLHPEFDLKGRGHQPYQAKIAAGTGKFFGKGPGNSLQKLSYLPEAQNDYIAAIYAEEFGFFGISFLIFLYMMLAFIGFSIAHQAADKQGMYLATAITFLISFQAFLNMGVVSGFLPSTGLNLPLFSQGGTSLMANIVGVGILMDISRNSPNE